MKGFKEFILRGNVVGLAVAFVIGGAFATVVQALVKDFVSPLIAVPGSGADFTSYTFTVGHGTFKYGDFITAVIAFVVIAAVIYFALVVPMQRLESRRTAPSAEADTRPCPECLSNIPIKARRCAFCTATVPPGAGG
jgi:large conductance mechanosensitive channel